MRETSSHATRPQLSQLAELPCTDLDLKSGNGVRTLISTGKILKGGGRERERERGKRRMIRRTFPEILAQLQGKIHYHATVPLKLDPLYNSKDTQTEVAWACLPFIISSQNHLARHSERGKKTRKSEQEVGRQH